MKKILIVNDNLYLGGIQKSLVNLLKDIHEQCDITLLLLNANGELLAEIPNDIKIIEACRAIRVLGTPKSKLKGDLFRYIWKGLLIVISKKISKKWAFRIAGITQKKIDKEFDIAISYSHASKGNDLRSCSAEFVLEKTIATQKVCFIHADYHNEANRCNYTDLLYRKFDKIACCSESVKRHFIDFLPDLSRKTYTVRNFYDLAISNRGNKCTIGENLIKIGDNTDYFYYDKQYINIISVARFTSEKGILRAIKALYESDRKDIRYYLIGDGPQKKEIQNMIKILGLTDQVFIMGKSVRPYYYMKNADYLLVPSFHEAAPIVFDEAKLMGLMVITTNTTSAMEIIGREDGIICENSMEGIRRVLYMLKRNHCLFPKSYNNNIQRKQFFKMLDL